MSTLPPGKLAVIQYYSSTTQLGVFDHAYLTSPACDLSLPPRSSRSTPGTPPTLHSGTRTAALTSPGITLVLDVVAACATRALWSVRRELRVKGDVREMIDAEGWTRVVDAWTAVDMSVLDNMSPCSSTDGEPKKVL